MKIICRGREHDTALMLMNMVIYTDEGLEPMRAVSTQEGAFISNNEGIPLGDFTHSLPAACLGQNIARKRFLVGLINFIYPKVGKVLFNAYRYNPLDVNDFSSGAHWSTYVLDRIAKVVYVYDTDYTGYTNRVRACGKAVQLLIRSVGINSHLRLVAPQGPWQPNRHSYSPLSL
jgi:hypothetical protein